MEEQRGISSGFVLEPKSDSGFCPISSGEKRKGNELEEVEKDDESESKRVKLLDPDSDAKSITIQPNLSSEHMLAPKELVVKDIKLSTDVEMSTCLPTADSNTSNDVLVKIHTVKDDSNCEPRGGGGGVSKTKEVTGIADSDLVPSNSSPVSEKVGTFQMGKSDSMRRWMEMKKNGFVSGPLGGVAAPSAVVTSTPVEIPATTQKQTKVIKRRGGDSVKKRSEVSKKEQQQQVDRFSNITGPSGLLTELNPGIINRVRTRKQVCSIIETLIGHVGERRHNLNVRESVREGRALAFKLPSIARSIPSTEQAKSVVEAATVALQWLEFLHQDLKGRLSAVQDSKKRVQNIITTELPLLFSSSNKESTLKNTSSDKTVTETHQMRWSEKFDHLNKALCEEERDLEFSLKQVKEMQSRCNDGLSFGKDGSEESSMAVQAAAASIFSTCSYLLSMMKPSPTSS